MMKRHFIFAAHLQERRWAVMLNKTLTTSLSKECDPEAAAGCIMNATDQSGVESEWASPRHLIRAQARRSIMSRFMFWFASPIFVIAAMTLSGQSQQVPSELKSRQFMHRKLEHSQ